MCFVFIHFYYVVCWFVSVDSFLLLLLLFFVFPSILVGVIGVKLVLFLLLCVFVWFVVCMHISCLVFFVSIYSFITCVVLCSFWLYCCVFVVCAYVCVVVVFLLILCSIVFSVSSPLFSVRVL